jgi:hypothetical protein
VACDVREGDDASCLNLSRVERPRLLGVAPELFQDRGAFRFAELDSGMDASRPWMALEAELGAGEIPAVVDETVMKWTLQKSLGDTLSYVDDFGRQVELRLVGALQSSVFQGSLLISAQQFREHFPDSAGARFLLVDAAPGTAANAATEAGRLLRPYGVTVESAADRLSSFTTVQNTYLAVFLLLGGLGVLLGSACLGLVVARNIRESRAELALLEAVGFAPRSLLVMVAAEQLPVLAAGVLAGMLSAAVAVAPVIAGDLAELAHGAGSRELWGGRLVLVAGLCGGVLAVGIASLLAAFWRTRQGDLYASLRAD